jgi:hypothetical protein
MGEGCQNALGVQVREWKRKGKMETEEEVTA